MERLTKALESNGLFIVDDFQIQHDANGYSGEAINKLAKFENFYDDLIFKQSEISMGLEKLRFEGKTNSVKFKQLLTNKMTNHTILILLKTYGLQ
ncbi:MULTISPECIES: hypothetical protein [Dehalobacter]|jgi:hypothetical protein|uniref:Uncharacterized protein n=2 Tax=Dehalobacter restrictus TaxID=55583 RepID=A0A857DKA8_9FIRM|nr:MULTISPECIES: hypothetical protein [Dehalobacter]AHF11461.1 hypothetical protein DEHRE_12260 [Dehalobacter restrictus DSM 9455]MCG1025745.1 hypothetical protein [Dehalobacter sp.]MDJ0307005.1 hypothetical protein [Dehalobacter sp.]OCZ54725.1 hypothetical protein A7D23_05140 [Dehalobacter sp. TeCB1]QHA01377.1 hypothetical protein GQ588_12365 [Dehalobacter restrictus]